MSVSSRIASPVHEHLNSLLQSTLSPTAPNTTGYSQAKHAWIILAFLLAWAVQQVVWVYADSSHEACYGVFDAKRVHSLLTAIVASMVVVAVVFGEGNVADVVLLT